MNKSGKIGFMLAPLIGAITFMLLVFIFGEDNSPKKDYSGAQAWPFYFSIFLVVTLFCYLLTTIIGIPLVIFLDHYRKLKFWILLLLSSLIGAISLTSVIYFIARDEAGISVVLLFFSAYGAVVGAVISITYCWLAGVIK